MMIDIANYMKIKRESKPLQLRSTSESRCMKLLPIFYHQFSNKNNVNNNRSTESMLTFSRQEEKEALVYVLKYSGCRISELLNVVGSDVMSDTEFLIRGLKGSASRTLRFPELSPMLVEARKFPERHLFLTRYITLYRFLLSCGYYSHVRGNKNRAVAHSFRYAKIRALSDVTRDDKVTADCIGHRSKRTSHRYLQKGL